VGRRAVRLAAVGVVAAVLVGCSSGSSDVELTEDNVDDALLTEDEIPFGGTWSGEDDRLSGDDLEVDLYEVDREECERTKADSAEAETGASVFLTNEAFADTADEGVAISQGIWVFEDDDLAEQVMEAIIAENSGRVECEDGIESTDDDEESLSPIPDGAEVDKGTHCEDKGDRYACYAYETTDESGFEVGNSDTYIRVGNAVIGLFVFDYGGDVDDEDLEALTDNAIEKVRTGEDLDTGGS
jgi:hypothetical protein